MARPRYPLESLRLLREREKAEHAAELGRAMSRRSAAARAAEQARVARVLAEEALSRALGAEAERLSAGTARAADLIAADEYRDAEERQIEAQRVAERARNDAALEAGGKENLARAALAGARARERVVERHEERFRDAERDARERRDEETAEDVHRARGTGAKDRG